MDTTSTPRKFESRRSRANSVNSLKRWKPGSPEHIEAERALREDLLTEHVRRVVDTFPPLTAEQRERVAAILRPTSDGPR